MALDKIETRESQLADRLTERLRPEDDALYDMIPHSFCQSQRSLACQESAPICLLELQLLLSFLFSHLHGSARTTTRWLCKS